jgi:hypothetical protein
MAAIVTATTTAAKTSAQSTPAWRLARRACENNIVVFTKTEISNLDDWQPQSSEAYHPGRALSSSPLCAPAQKLPPEIDLQIRIL